MSEPPAEYVQIDAGLVTQLLSAQHGDLADLPVRIVAQGWDNVIARLGERLAVRLPRREPAARLIEHEIRWLPQLAQVLPLPIPVPVRTGNAGEGYPWRWTITPWIEGRTAVGASLADPDDAADLLGRFLRALHQPAPADAPANPFRGIPLAERDDRTRAAIGALAPHPRRAATAIWEDALSAARWPGPAVWLHGDLHPANLIVRASRPVAVIDFGDLTSGDPACDLAVAWMLLPPGARERLVRASGHDPCGGALERRIRGWALALALAYLEAPPGDTVVLGIGRRTLASVLDAGP